MTDLHTLLLNWQSIDADIHDLEVRRHNLEQQIASEMSVTRAEYAEVKGVEATLKPSVEYDATLDGPLAAMAEMLSPEEIESLLTAEKPPPPRKFHMQRVKALAKRGEPFISAIEKATLRGPARVKVRKVAP